jgi:O-antigen ligase
LPEPYSKEVIIDLMPVMLSLQRFQRKPFLILGTLWPVVLLAPHLPGIPRPSVNGLPWRQELVLALLLTLTLGFFLVKRSGTEGQARTNRDTLVPPGFAALFVVWIWLSVAWATDHYQALHLAIQWSSYLVFFSLIIAAPAKVIRSSFITLGIIIWMLALACAIESWFGAPLTDGNLRVAVKPLLRGSGGFGEIMGATSILFAAFALHLKRLRPALMCGATAVVGWLATLQSLERAPLIGAFAGLLLLFTGAFVKPSKRLFWRLGSLTAAFALVLLLQAMPSRLTNHDVSTVSRLQQNLPSDANTQARFLLWGAGLEIMRAHPFLGVGGNNYQVNFGEGRAQFSARYPNSPLVAVNEHLLPIYAHNEYLQMAAELGIIGLVLFVLFGVSLVANFVKALRVKGQSLPVLGAGGAMLAFAISSGASASSFRYLSGGLIFFFAAALIGRRVNNVPPPADESKKAVHFPGKISGKTLRLIGLSFCALMPLSVALFTTQAVGITLHGLAETSSDANEAERYYRASLQVYPANTAAHFGYGMWLYGRNRSNDGVPYLRYAVERGFNSSICFAYLAAAENSAGDLDAAERTLATAVRVYPLSLFLLVRHSAALKSSGRAEESKTEFSRAVLLDSRAALGWQQLIDNDIDAAYVAARQDETIAMPGELVPQAAVFEVLQENEQRFPEAITTGWRAKMHSMRLR